MKSGHDNTHKPLDNSGQSFDLEGTLVADDQSENEKKTPAGSGDDERSPLAVPSQPFLSIGESYSAPSQGAGASAAASGSRAGGSGGDADDELIGTIYVGKYELIGRLGAGGMGVIYLGRQIFLDRLVAIKMLKSNMASPKARMRFHQEGKAASALNHPGIVAINDFGSDEEDRPYMVMEYVEGVTLSDIIRDRGHLSFDEALPIFLEILEALSVAHSRGIVHRDIKPSNIMLAMGIDGVVRVKLLDFGIAKLLDEDDNTIQSLTKTGESLGTPLYMSPEQIVSRKVDYRSDLYSFGCVMYVCLTGIPPFVGENKLSTMEMHVGSAPLPMSKLMPGLHLPPELDSIALHLLAKAPEGRYQSAEAVRQALLSVAVSGGILPEAILSAPRTVRERTVSQAMTISESLSALVPAPTAGQGFTGADATQALTHKPGSLPPPRPATPGPLNNTQTQRTLADPQRILVDPQRTLADPQRTLADSDTGHTELSATVHDRPIPNISELAATGSQTESYLRAARDAARDAAGADERAVARRRYEADEIAEEDDESDSDENSSLLGRLAQPRVVISAVVAFLVAGIGLAVFVGSNGEKKASPPQSTVAPADVHEGVRLNVSDDEVLYTRLKARPDEVNLSLQRESVSTRCMQLIGKLTKLQTLDLTSAKFTAADLQYLSASPVRELRLQGTAVDDSSMRYLARMPGLKLLVLARTAVSDVGMADLGRAPCLENLILSGCSGISDDGLIALAKSDGTGRTLHSIDLERCMVTGRGVMALQDIPNLNGLNLRRTAFREHLHVLPFFRNLSMLDISSNSLMDSDLKVLTRMEKLTILDISNNNLTMGCLPYLQKVKHLLKLYLVGMNLSRNERDRLTNGLPNCQFEFTGRPSPYWADNE